MTERNESFHVISQALPLEPRAEAAERAAESPASSRCGDQSVDSALLPPLLGSARDPFSRALRVSGALLLATSASTFMFQHWGQQSDVMCYWMLLGHTLVVALAALLCSSGLQAVRSARTLFGLVLASTPVHFTVLGALLYSRLGALRVDLPGSAVWSAPSLAAALLAAGGAALLLIPASLLALQVLARSHARKLGATLAFSNAMLLIPVRQPTLIGLILIALTWVLLVIDRRFELAHELRTVEARAVRLLCFASPCVMAGRALLYYDVTTPFVASVLAIGGLTWFSLWGRSGFTRRAVALQRWAIAPIAIAACLISSDLIAPSVSTLCFCALLTAMLVPMGQRALGGASFYGAAAGWLCCCAVGMDALTGVTAASATAALIVGACAMVGAAFVQRFGLLLAAAVTTLMALCMELALMVDFGALKHWGTLAVAGLVLILGAAVLEKHGRRLGQGALAMREQISAWDW